MSQEEVWERRKRKLGKDSVTLFCHQPPSFHLELQTILVSKDKWPHFTLSRTIHRNWLRDFWFTAVVKDGAFGMNGVECDTLLRISGEFKIHVTGPGQSGSVVGRRTENLKVTSSIPGQGMCLGCGFSPQFGCIEKLADASLPLFLSHFPSL